MANQNDNGNKLSQEMIENLVRKIVTVKATLENTTNRNIEEVEGTLEEIKKKHISKLKSSPEKVKSLTSQYNNDDISSSDESPSELGSSDPREWRHLYQDKPTHKRKIEDSSESDDGYDLPALKDMYVPDTTHARYLDYNDRSHDLVPIGLGYAHISFKYFRSIRWGCYTTATRMLMSALFTNEVMATHSILGRPALQDKPGKGKLDEKIVFDIIDTVSKLSKVPRRLVMKEINLMCKEESLKIEMGHKSSEIEEPQASSSK